jgi:hypothetical protein
MHSTGAQGNGAVYPPFSAMTPCRFPRFSRLAKHSGLAAARRPITSVRVAVDQADKLLSLSATDADALAAVLRTAWALLLQCYTGRDDVNFGFQHGGDTNLRASAGVRVARFVLDSSSSVGETLNRTKTEFVGRISPVSQVSDDQTFHTLVVLWDITKASAPCQVMAPVSIHDPYLPPWHSLAPRHISLTPPNSNNKSASWRSVAAPAWACS